MFEQAFKNIDDILRKEAGCTTELDYTEQTSWLLFLKYLDGLEHDLADQAALGGKKYAYILDKPYRWESWAAPKGKGGTLDHDKAQTGDDLCDFVNQKLFPYLHGFKQRATGPNTIEYKIGEIFGEIKNKIQSGYSLRDIIDGVDELRFRSQNEKHELMARGYVAGYEQDQRREAALNTALVQQRHAFTHFVTVTFPDVITELEAVIAINKSLRSLGRLNQKRVRYFYELSLAPQHGFASATESSSGDAEMVTRWHVHLLLGGLNGEITCRHIAHAFHHATGGFVDVQVTDGSPRLSEYLSARSTGNRVGKLQRTNDLTITKTMARFGEVI